MYSFLKVFLTILMSVFCIVHIYFIKLNLSACVCVFSIEIHSSRPISTKLGMKHPWRQGQEQGQVADAFGRGAQRRAYP